jgi:hypothetical protein
MGAKWAISLESSATSSSTRRRRSLSATTLTRSINVRFPQKHFSILSPFTSKTYSYFLIFVNDNLFSCRRARWEEHRDALREQHLRVCEARDISEHACKASDAAGHTATGTGKQRCRRDSTEWCWLSRPKVFHDYSVGRLDSNG